MSAAEWRESMKQFMISHWNKYLTMLAHFLTILEPVAAIDGIFFLQINIFSNDICQTSQNELAYNLLSYSRACRQQP